MSFYVKLNRNNFAVIQSCGFSDNQISARIGIAVSDRKYVEFFNLINWEFSYAGNNEVMANKLKSVYLKNIHKFKEKIISLKT